MFWAPGNILMSIHDHVLDVVILKQIVPINKVEMESVMEDKLQAGLLLTHHISNLSIERL